MGRVSLPMDVNSESKIPAFESMLSKGPMAVVLVYADWCGHCDRYKKNVWSPLKSVKNRTVNMMSVREDILPKTSLSNAKIDGYPSILVVGQDKQPAVFNTTSGQTNALPESNDVSTMKSLVTSEVPNEATLTATNNSRNSNVNTGVNISYPSLMASAPSAASVNSTNAFNSTRATNSVNSANASNTFNSASVNSANSANATNSANNMNENFAINTEPTATNVSPPSIEEDEAEVVQNVPRTSTANNQGTTPILRGGRLFRRLSVKHRKARKNTRKAKRTSKRKN